MVDYEICTKFLLRDKADVDKLRKWFLKSYGTSEMVKGMSGDEAFPLNQGVITIAPWDMYLTFEKLTSRKANIRIYCTGMAEAIVDYDFTIAKVMEPSFTVNEISGGGHSNPYVAAKFMEMVKSDGLIEMTSLIYTATMFCYQFGAEYVTGERSNYKPAFSKSKTTAENRLEAVHMIRKTYVLTEGEMKPIRHYRSPDCEFDVKGHVRHYKSGKTVYVKPFVKGVGKKRKEKVYIV